MLVSVPTIKPYINSRAVEQRVLYCNFSKGENSKSCYPIVLFEDGTVFTTTRLIAIQDFAQIDERDEFYNKFGDSGWGKYTFIGDTLKFTYAEYFNYGGSMTYHEIEHTAIHFENTLTLLPNPKLSDGWHVEHHFVKMDSIDISFIDPSKAWICRR